MPLADRDNVLIQIHLPAEVDRIKLVRPGVEAAARMCGLSLPVARDVVLAIDEACQNIIVHGYKGQRRGQIDIMLCRHEDGLLAEIRDTAPRVDPKKIVHRALNDLKPGKLGTYFMSKIMDQLEYLPAPGGGNLLRMFKRKDPSS
jgi:sigma-B regulation protein RsbU (phosphoserine phosphatase)